MPDCRHYSLIPSNYPAMKKFDQEKLLTRISRLQKQVASYREKLGETREQARLLAKKTRQLEILLNEFPGYLVLLQDGKILLTNNRILSELGYERGSVRGKPFDEFIHQDSLEFVTKIYRKRLRGETAPYTYDLNLVDNWGQAVPCEARIVKIRYNGRRAFLVSLTPLRNRKASEAKRLREQKQQLISRFSQGIAQQLQLCTSLLEHCAEQVKAEKSYLGNSIQALLQVQEAQKRLIDILTILQHEKAQECGTANLANLIEEARSIATRLVASRGKPNSSVTVECFIRATPVVKGDPLHIREAIAHIIANGMEASYPGGKVLISLEETSESAYVYIQDNGNGIATEEQEKIFDPFYTSKPGNLGLGLTLAAAALHKYGGDIEVISRPGRGTSFTLILPVSKRPPTIKIPPPGKVLKNRRLMLMGESDAIIGLLTEVLKAKGAEVAIPSNLKHALRLISKGKVDMVIMDLENSAPDFTVLLQKVATVSPALPFICLAPDDESAAGLSSSTGNIENMTIMRRPFNVDDILAVASRKMVLISKGESHERFRKKGY
ncbi:MAG: hypothetical protein DRH15_10635 [Deltaproteobacteria bacterium]|nr:MAG: hypothetical protein DRH15_10635 [Deltaproteobacteria bacterium]